METNDERLRSDLDRLDRWQSAVFAASCVETLFPAYSRFVEIEEVGDADFARSTLDSVWESLETGCADTGDGVTFPSRDEVLRLLPEEEDWNDWAPQAENAIGALSIVLDIIQGRASASAAADAAYQAYEAADELANRRELGEEPLNDEDNRSVDSSIVEDETERQEYTVRALLQRQSGDARLVRTLRENARQRALGGTE